MYQISKITFVERSLKKVINTLFYIEARNANTECKDPPTGVNEASCAGDSSAHRGLVLGAYCDDNPKNVFPILSRTAEKFNDKTRGRLYHQLQISGPIPKVGEARAFYDMDPRYNCVVVAGLGVECMGYDDVEERDEGKEAIRIAAAAGCRLLQEHKVTKLAIEDFSHSESSAEGALLGMWVYQEMKRRQDQLIIPAPELYDSCDISRWKIGVLKADAQNLARRFMETPANMMTPTLFAQTAVEVLCKSGVNVEVKVQGWCQTQRMGAFLGVTQGSCEPPIFLEISYYGANYDERPIVLVGSGITFDSGGMCLKGKHGMENTRGYISGAACVLATTRALAALQVPINIRGLIPLCENMPGCSALKPGDIVTAMNGKNILIEDTDCEGRLLMADALLYAQNFWPRFIIDVGTLTEDVERAMGSTVTAAFTNSDELWKRIQNAGVHTGDRVWRFPLWDYFSSQVSASKSVDLENVGRGIGGGTCRAAAFLREFVPCGEWIHLDTMAVMMTNGKDFPYLRPGMTGRPTRTLIEFISQIACACDEENAKYRN